MTSPFDHLGPLLVFCIALPACCIWIYLLVRWFGYAESLTRERLAWQMKLGVAFTSLVCWAVLVAGVLHATDADRATIVLMGWAFHGKAVWGLAAVALQALFLGAGIALLAVPLFSRWALLASVALLGILCLCGIASTVIAVGDTGSRIQSRGDIVWIAFLFMIIYLLKNAVRFRSPAPRGSQGTQVSSFPA